MLLLALYLICSLLLSEYLSLVKDIMKEAYNLIIYNYTALRFMVKAKKHRLDFKNEYFAKLQKTMLQKFKSMQFHINLLKHVYCFSE